MAEQTKPRVLIVEDYDAILTTYEFLLCPLFDITFYRKSNDVADDIAAGKLDVGVFEAAVMDHKLGQGQMSGNDLMRLVLEKDRTLAGVLATAFEESSIAALSPNAFRFVVKKGDFAVDLIDRIRECIAQTRVNRQHGG